MIKNGDPNMQQDRVLALLGLTNWQEKHQGEQTNQSMVYWVAEIQRPDQQVAGYLLALVAADQQNDSQLGDLFNKIVTATGLPTQRVSLPRDVLSTLSLP
jgi:hypothetical protein